MDKSEEGNNQDAVNEAQWQTQSNWVGPLWLGIYRSKRDTRLIVPHPHYRWAIFRTFNFGHPNAWLGVLLALGFGFAIGFAAVRLYLAMQH